MEEQWVAPTEAELEQIRYYEERAAVALAESEAERRRHCRAPFQAEITLSSATNFFMGFSEDISEGGLFLSTMSPPPVGEQVTLEIKVSGGRSVTVEGEVRWHRYVADTVTGCGVKFSGLDPDAKQQFEQHLIDLQKEPLFFEL